jgi:hypothetical protein
MNRDEISRIAKECGLTVEQSFHSPAIQKFASRIESLVREKYAVLAWQTGMYEHSKALGMPCDAREVGSAVAAAIRKSEG